MVVNFFGEKANRGSEGSKGTKGSQVLECADRR